MSQAFIDCREEDESSLMVRSTSVLGGAGRYLTYRINP